MARYLLVKYVLRCWYIMGMVIKEEYMLIRYVATLFKVNLTSPHNEEILLISSNVHLHCNVDSNTDTKNSVKPFFPTLHQ